jgi:P pilus assembly chaperone PapD
MRYAKASPSIKMCMPLAWSAAAIFAPPASAELMLFPTRVVFEGPQKSAQVELVNQGATVRTYRLNLVNRRMTESGDFKPAEQAEGGEQFAHELVKFSPRQVTLQPGGSQTVRIVLRKPEGLSEGEYRSHLQFDLVPDSQPDTSIETEGDKKAGGVGVVLKALVGASIPVIVRQGTTQVSVGLQDLKWAPPTPSSPAQVQFTLTRQGNRSVYGDIEVKAWPLGANEAVALGKASGVALYVPNALRRANLNLITPQGLDLSKARLDIQYKERAEQGGALLARSDITLP